MLRFRVLTLFSLLAVLPPLLLSGCDAARQFTALEQVKHEGELRVLTRNSATTYFVGPEGPTGLEYDLAKAFADHLGVKLTIVVAPNVSDVLHGLAKGEAHLAAAGLTVTRARERWARFTPPYQHITEQLVYRLGTETPRPTSIGKLDGHLEVVANSSHVDSLYELKKNHPELVWTENAEAESEELLTLVSERVIDYTVADSNELKQNQRFYPELRVAFDISAPQPLAWAFPRTSDGTLYEEAVRFFDTIKANGRLAHVLDRHYGHLDQFDYVGTRIYRRHIQTRLPEYIEQFRRAGVENGLDWRLLAAMAYQESHWDPDAVSPTGVRGIMMLTRVTAEQLGVDKRTDPAQSIEGGGRYLRMMIDRVPERIKEPDRIWLALAAYNIGFGHLEDARIITEKRNGDADRWMDVKDNLPLLRKKKWYRQTRYGYARGNEAARYVENIRRYYDLLVWLTEQEQETPAPAPRGLSIISPVL